MKCIAWDATDEAAEEEAKMAYENGSVPIKRWDTYDQCCGRWSMVKKII